jgi:hypothetical protein
VGLSLPSSLPHGKRDDDECDRAKMKILLMSRARKSFLDLSFYMDRAVIVALKKQHLVARKLLIFFLILFFSQKSFAADHGSDHAQIFHAFTLEGDVGEARDGRSRGLVFLVGLEVIIIVFGSKVRKKVTENTKKN